MTKPQIHKEQMDFLTERAIRFFNLYGDELDKKHPAKAGRATRTR